MGDSHCRMKRDERFFVLWLVCLVVLVLVAALLIIFG